MSSRFFSFIMLVITVTFLPACSSHPQLPGVWQYSDIEHRGSKSLPVTIVKTARKEFYIEANDAAFSGSYVWHGQKLIMEKPNNPRMEGFVFEYRDGQLIIVSQPPIRLASQKFIGGVLLRN